MALTIDKSLLDQTKEKAQGAVPVVESALDTLIDAAKEGIEAAKGAAKDVAAASQAKVSEVAEASPSELYGGHDDAEGSGGGRWFKRLLVLGLLAAIGGIIFKRMRDSQQAADNWQSAYVPPPPPVADGEVGAAPDDAAAEPHEPTTPDAPVEVVEVADEETAKES
ncbi:MAG: hypothetical protein QM714_13300 [Nocardioides sp.]|uniref:hypothetical protein n=1 Tax=Nocardioides sp. TaxID=35761 RepID=UPI0039E53C0A